MGPFASLPGMSLRDVAFRPPGIRTARVTLRGWEPEDAEAIYAYASDPEVTPHVGWDRATSLADAQAFLDTVVAPNFERQELDYCITLRGAEHLCIGGMGLYWHRKEYQVMELGYVLNRAHWGQGYVPEAGRALIAHAFATTPVERIFAPIFAPNQKSRRAAEKMGLKLEGVHRSALNLRGQRWDEAIYAIVRGDDAHAP